MVMIMNGMQTAIWKNGEWVEWTGYEDEFGPDALRGANTGSASDRSLRLEDPREFARRCMRQQRRA
ncbi:hypothetical protein [uncultured Jannaschia sp.]|uniref:hypothetical protein n=1 Tax=uncultured Jannaschia sp. TaxID=293347 RepID=UPI00261806C3|nr:hypothetical protein [uncultured Jannaschia sp.]